MAKNMEKTSRVGYSSGFFLIGDNTCRPVVNQCHQHVIETQH